MAAVEVIEVRKQQKYRNLSIFSIVIGSSAHRRNAMVNNPRKVSTIKYVFYAGHWAWCYFSLHLNFIENSLPSLVVYHVLENYGKYVKLSELTEAYSLYQKMSPITTNPNANTSETNGSEKKEKFILNAKNKGRNTRRILYST